MSVRIPAANHAVDLGLRDRAVYNSINYTLNEDEIQAINETGLRAAVIQAFNPRNPRPEGIDRWRRIGEHEENAKKMCKAGAATVA